MKEIKKSKNIIIGDIENIGKLHVGDNITKIYQILGLSDENIKSKNLWENVKSTPFFVILQEKSEKNDEVKRLIAILALLFTHSKLFDEFKEENNENIEHALKVLKLFEILIPKETIENLNVIEISILLLSAYLHDIGIMLKMGEKEEIKASVQFEEFKKKHKQAFESIKNISSEKFEIEANLAENYMLKIFLKPFHFERTYKYIKENLYEILTYKGISFCEDLALVCASHSIDTWSLGHKEQVGRSNIDKYRRDKKIAGLKCNIQYLSICLKLADILSFDEEYFPVELIEYIGEKEKIFYSDWIKHLKIDNWQITNRDLIYEVQCTHPVYQHFLFKLLELIEDELDKSTYLISDNNTEIAKTYKINISRKVNLDYIQPLDFIYGPLKFELDYLKVVNLLMGEQLYGRKNIVVRELLQNAIDACKHREILENLTGSSQYIPTIRVDLKTQDGKYVLIVEDNGVGMDLHIVQNYLINVGSSYYRSREFEKLKNIYSSKGIEFDPVSRFGIGILSCFMIAEKIEIETYRMNPEFEDSQPLFIQVEGNNKFFIIRENEKKEFGTKLTLFIKDSIIEDEDTIFDEFNLFTRLEELVNKFALHIGVDIIVNKNTLIQSKDFDLISFINYTKRTHKNFKLGRHEKDYSHFLNPIEVELERKSTLGFFGKIFFLSVLDDMNKFSFSNKNYWIEDNNVDYGRIIDVKTLKEAITSVWTKSLDNKQREILANWLHEKFGITVNGNILDKLNLFFLKCIFSNQWYFSYRFEEVETILSEIASIFTQKVKYLHSIILNLQGKGSISCDGILINDGYGYSNTEIYFTDVPITYDINFTGNAKPNLTASRNSFIGDKKFEGTVKSLASIISKAILDLYKEEGICDGAFDSFYFLNFLSRKIYPGDISLISLLFQDKEFLNKHLVLHGIVNGEEKFIKFPELFTEFKGRFVIPEHFFVKDVLNIYLFDFECTISELIQICSNVKYHTFENSQNNYYEVFIQNELLPDNQDIMCEYVGVHCEKLYVSNRLHWINSNHFLGKTIKKHRNGKFYEMLKRLTYLISFGEDEYIENKDKFMEEINLKLKYFVDTLPDDSSLKEDFKQGIISHEDLHYCYFN